MKPVLLLPLAGTKENFTRQWKKNRLPKRFIF
jgi:hypothetical protein